MKTYQRASALADDLAEASPACGEHLRKLLGLSMQRTSSRRGSSPPTLAASNKQKKIRVSGRLTFW